MTFKWTPEAKAHVAAMLGEGKSALQISNVFGMTRNCIISVVRRDKSLNAIGFAKPGERGRKVRMTSVEFRERRKLQARVWRATAKAKKLAEGRTVVIQFPKSPEHRKLELALCLPFSAQQKPRLSVVSNNVPLMIQDWLAKNGGARRFDEQESSASWMVRSFLAERGVTVGFVRGSDKWNLTRPGGRTKMGRDHAADGRDQDSGGPATVQRKRAGQAQAGGGGIMP